MARQKRRPANDRASKLYAAEKRVEANKLKKLVRHVNKNPNDSQSKSALTRVSTAGYEYNRARPKNINAKQVEQNKYIKRLADLLTIAKNRKAKTPETVTEQFLNLKGLQIPKGRRKYYERKCS